MTISDITYLALPSKPKIALPQGACDAHCHVFGPIDKFPYAKDARFRPGEAPKEKLFALHDLLGIDRCVIVQASCHGYDNAVVANAIAARPGRNLGVALLPVKVDDTEIQSLDAQGFRGVKFNYMAHLPQGPTLRELSIFVERLANFGWHLQIHLDNCYIKNFSSTLSQLPVPVVIDHMGRIDASAGPDQQQFASLMKLLENENIWVKVSGVERASRQDAPYGDAVPFARKLVESYPNRVLWGTDWPHPNFRSTPPDDGLLVDLLSDIAPTGTLLKALLVDNPMKFYGFPK